MKNTLIKIAAISALISAAAANAQDKSTLDLLVNKGLISREEADKVSKTENVVIKTKEKAAKSLTFSGRIQEQFQWLNTEPSNGSSPASKTGFRLRRVYLGVKADMGSGFYGNLDIDFVKTGTPGADYVAEAIIGKKMDYDYLQGVLEFGYKKVPFGFEENTSSSKLLSVEKSIATRYFVEPAKSGTTRNVGFGSRYIGAFWQGSVKQVKGLEYGVAVTNSTSYTLKPAGETNYGETGDNNLNAWANVAYSGKIDAVAFKAGLNAGWGPSANTVATNDYGEIIAVNPYIQIKWENLTFWSEFLMANVEKGKNNGADRATPMGLNIGAEYLFDLGDLGKAGPTVRYSWLDTDGRGAQIGDTMSEMPNAGLFNTAQSVMIGANWYIIGNNVKFQAGYEWAQFSGRVGGNSYSGHTDAHGLRMQVQVLF